VVETCQEFFVLWVSVVTRRLNPVKADGHNYERIHPLVFHYTPLTDTLLIHPSMCVTNDLYPLQLVM